MYMHAHSNVLHVYYSLTWYMKATCHVFSSRIILLTIHYANTYPQAIEGYRETEKSQWMENNTPVIQRLKEVAQTAVPNKTLTTLSEVHALDLSQDGHIKPHIDSVKVTTVI